MGHHFGIGLTHIFTPSKNEYDLSATKPLLNGCKSLHDVVESVVYSYDY